MDNERFRRMQLAGWFAVLAAASLSGCAFPRHYGDASVVNTRGNPVKLIVSLGMIVAGDSLSFPAIPLSKAGTTEFHADHLPPHRYEYYVHVTGVPAFPNGELDPVQAASIFGNTRVTVCATALDGMSLFNQELRLRDLAWEHNGSILNLRTNLPESGVLNYRLAVVVRDPLPTSSAKLHISAIGRESPAQITYR